MPATITLGCPTGGNVLVTLGSGSCSGSVGTICVRGTYTDDPSLVGRIAGCFRWLLELFGIKPAGPTPRTTSVTIRVRVLKGSQNITSPPTDHECWDVDAPVIGTAWCARPVEVPDWNASGRR